MSQNCVLTMDMMFRKVRYESKIESVGIETVEVERLEG